MDIRLGCKRDARKALLKELEFLDAGAYREVFVDRRRTVVYKVDRVHAGVPYRTNEGDMLAYRDLIASGAGCIAPTTSWMIGDRMVLCQPFYEKTASDLAYEDGKEFSFAESVVMDIAYENGIGDMHDQNWCVDAAGSPRIIDFGGHMYTPRGDNE